METVDGGVVVVAEQLDATADMVVDELNFRRVPVFRFDMAQFPQQLTLIAGHHREWAGVLLSADRAVRLDSVRAVYYRRPGSPNIGDAVPEYARRWSVDQAVEGLLGVLSALPRAVWVNNPYVDRAASHKPLQLSVAASCGLDVPRTLITNDPNAARDFAEEIPGRLVCKPLMGGFVDDELGQRRMVPTTVIEPESLDDSIRVTAHQLQEWIDKDHEVRLTVVGDHMFPATVHAGSHDALVDWRTNYEALTYGVTSISEELRVAVLAFMSRFGLSCAAFDFVVTPEGRWVFLECNPGGQWGWIQCETDLPIAAAIADLLERGSS